MIGSSYHKTYMALKGLGQEKNNNLFSFSVLFSRLHILSLLFLLMWHTSNLWEKTVTHSPHHVKWGFGGGWALSAPLQSHFIAWWFLTLTKSHKVSETQFLFSYCNIVPSSCGATGHPRRPVPPAEREECLSRVCPNDCASAYATLATRVFLSCFQSPNTLSYFKK